MVTSCSYLVRFLPIEASFVSLESRQKQDKFGEKAEMGKYEHDQE